MYARPAHFYARILEAPLHFARIPDKAAISHAGRVLSWSINGVYVWIHALFYCCLLCFNSLFLDTVTKREENKGIERRIGLHQQSEAMGRSGFAG